MSMYPVDNSYRRIRMVAISEDQTAFMSTECFSVSYFSNGKHFAGMKAV